MKEFITYNTRARGSATAHALHAGVDRTRRRAARNAALAVAIAAAVAGGTALTAYASMPLVKGADFKRQDVYPSAVDKKNIPDEIAADAAEGAQDAPGAEESAETGNYTEYAYDGPAYETWAPEIWGNDPSTLPPEIQDGAGLTRSGGVNYWNGTRETWYSSNVLYHYRTGEWPPDENGFYRTSEGYYVVASSDYPQGTVIETSQGQAQVLDSGCASGTVDFYTQW